MKVFQLLMGSPVALDVTSARLKLDDGKPGMLWWNRAPSNYYLRATVNASPGARAGIYLRTQRKPDAPEGKPLDQGYLLEVDPAETTVTLRSFNTWDRLAEIRRLRLNAPAGRPIEIEVFVNKDILEVFAGNQRSFVSRLFGEQQGGLALMAWDGPVSFENGFIGRIPS